MKVDVPPSIGLVVDSPPFRSPCCACSNLSLITSLSSAGDLCAVLHFSLSAETQYSRCCKALERSLYSAETSQHLQQICGSPRKRSLKVGNSCRIRFEGTVCLAATIQGFPVFRVALQHLRALLHTLTILLELQVARCQVKAALLPQCCCFCACITCIVIWSELPGM